MPYRNELKKESGVALLFALGILSLLLVLGLAFASNALLAQKVAANNSNRSQAKLLAQSAISRITIAMMYYQAQAAQQSPPIIPLNYSDVYSYGKDGQTENGNIFADGLYSTSDSLLKPPASLAAVMTDSTTYAKPKWTFIYDKPLPSSGTSSSATRKIIGRIAYQQVITPAQSKISLYNVLLGIDPQDTTPPRGPWDNRWGQTIDELNLDQTTPLNDWGNKAPGSSGDPLDTSNLTLFFDRFSGSGQYFYKYNEIGTAGFVNKKFIERWFTSGTEPTEPEYYRFDISSNDYKFLHRFNLGKLDECDPGEDKWYYRFHENIEETLDKNGPGILTNLAADGDEFNLTDEVTPSTTGIPFLKQIADTQETFASLADRRKQIAANLNDYCDPDSIPTSDVPAANWGVNEGITEPTFTGNERTPYIYELGYKLEIYHQADGATKTKGFEVDVTKKELGFQLALFPAVKLAQIYENIPDDFQKFIFKNSVKAISLEGEIIEAKYNDIKYKYKNGGSEVEALASGTIEVAKFADKEIKFKPKWNITPSTETGELLLNKPNDADNNISFDLSLTGYPFGEAKDSNNWHGEKYQTDVSELFNEKILKEVVKSTTSHDPTNIVIVSGPTSVEITKVNVSEVTVKRGALLLQGQLKDTSSPFGVDFVKAPTREENSLKFNPTGSALSLSKAEAFTFLLGGIQGMDPRQNLNEDDWYISARATAGTSKWDAVMDVTLGPPIIGKANESQGSDEPAHPFNPGEASDVDASKYDPEKNVDSNGPAWGDATNHLSTAYIRNAPMQSLWELGVIHRGAAWQTLNLKAAGAPGGTGSISPSDMKQGLSWDNPSGTSYANGDGGILEQVKLTENAYCYGKVNINMLCSDTTINIGYEHAHDYQMGQALFYNIMYGQEISNFETTTSSKKIGVSTTIGNALAQACVNEAGTKKPFSSRTQFLDWELSSGNDLCNAFGAIDITNSSDAQREEIVGKTINLIKAEPSPPNVIQFIVVAQTIRDVGGTIVKINPDDGTAVSLPCSLGSFDAYRYKNNSDSTSATDSGKADQSQDDYLYFDEITSEVKMLVTLEKVSEVTGQIVVTSIEYLD